MGKKVVYKKRTFLNSDDESLSAFVVAYLEEFSHTKGERDVSCYPVLDFGDCSNKVSLDFCFYTEEEMRNRQKKLKVLRDVVNAFADSFDKEVEKYEEAVKDVPKTVKRKRKKTEE